MPSSNPGKRVDDILTAITKIGAYVDDIGGIDALMKDEFVHRDAVERQLLIISEAATKLRGHVEDQEPEIDWNAIRGMGNFIRHSYDDVDDQIVQQVLTAELVPLKQACERLKKRSFKD